MNKRIDLVNDFKDYLEECNRVTTSYSGSYMNYKERCDVYFYEWSDLNSVPKRFSNSKEFFKFLDECKISITDGLKHHFDDRYTFHATCFKGSNVLCLASSKFQLETLLKKIEESKTIPTSDSDRVLFYPTSSGVNNNYHPMCGNYPYRGCGGYDDYYDEWD